MLIFKVVILIQIFTLITNLQLQVFLNNLLAFLNMNTFMDGSNLFPGASGIGLPGRVDSSLELSKVHKGGRQPSEVGNIVEQ